jgi:MFS transporter, MHS family, citrate/tricarballylate:H+ symporter
MLGRGLTLRLTGDQITRWGWWISLLVGCAIIPLLFLLWRSLKETPEFLERKHHPSPRHILRTLARGWRLVVLGTLLTIMNTVIFYMITAYTPSFGGAVLHLAARTT